MRYRVGLIEGREPEWNRVGLSQSRLYLEMAMMAHASHRMGARVSLPLKSTRNPFDDWTSCDSI
ncbi:MAG: hypothetical protein O3B73_02975 [bacterium]|nr:hypothetical protein [bacterium]